MSMGSELRCRSGGAEFVCLGVFVSQLGCVLIGSSSPVSRSSSSRITHRFPPSLLAGLAFLFFFRLGSATDHSSHTPLLALFSMPENHSRVDLRPSDATSTSFVTNSQK